MVDNESARGQAPWLAKESCRGALGPERDEAGVANLLPNRLLLDEWS